MSSILDISNEFLDSVKNQKYCPITALEYGAPLDPNNPDGPRVKVGLACHGHGRGIQAGGCRELHICALHIMDRDHDHQHAWSKSLMCMCGIKQKMAADSALSERDASKGVSVATLWAAGQCLELESLSAFHKARYDMEHKLATVEIDDGASEAAAVEEANLAAEAAKEEAEAAKEAAEAAKAEAAAANARADAVDNMPVAQVVAFDAADGAANNVPKRSRGKGEASGEKSKTPKAEARRKEIAAAQANYGFFHEEMHIPLGPKARTAGPAMLPGIIDKVCDIDGHNHADYDEEELEELRKEAFGEIKKNFQWFHEEFKIPIGPDATGPGAGMLDGVIDKIHDMDDALVSTKAKLKLAIEELRAVDATKYSHAKLIAMGIMNNKKKKRAAEEAEEVVAAPAGKKQRMAATSATDVAPSPMVDVADEWMDSD